jgi:hypothetical protein
VLGRTLGVEREGLDVDGRTLGEAPRDTCEEGRDMLDPLDMPPPPP